MLTYPTQACKVLLDAGAPLDTKASSGGTALMFAAAAGYTDVVTLLVERGTEVNATVEVIYDLFSWRLPLKSRLVLLVQAHHFVHWCGSFVTAGVVENCRTAICTCIIVYRGEFGCCVCAVCVGHARV